MKRIRLNQFLIRIKTAWKILTNPKLARVLISLEKQDVRAMITEDDFEMDLDYHKIQPYNAYKLINPTMVDQDEMVLLKAKFEAEGELYSEGKK